MMKERRVQEELGDLLQSVLYWCMVEGFDVEETLKLSREKFDKRIQVAKKLADKRGYSRLVSVPISVKSEIWEDAKSIANKG